MKNYKMNPMTKIIETNKKLVVASLVTNDRGLIINYTFNVNLSVPCVTVEPYHLLPTIRFKNIANEIEKLIADKLEDFEIESELKQEEYKTKADKIKYIIEHQMASDDEVVKMVTGDDSIVNDKFNKLFNTE